MLPRVFIVAIAVVMVLSLATCGPSSATIGGSTGGGSGGGSAGSTDSGSAKDASVQSDAGSSTVEMMDAGPLPVFDAGLVCPPLPAPPSAGVTIAPEFASTYAVYELGPVPGVPGPLGGCVVLRSDRNTLWIAGASEDPQAGFYKITVTRNACGHIVGFSGTAQRTATAPYMDATLVEVADGSLLYTGWPVKEMSQIRPGDSTPLWTVNLEQLGQNGDSAGGLGMVPKALSGGGGLRIVGWPDGKWHHVNATVSGGLYTVSSVSSTNVQLDGGPGGFAYVPAGSPGFPKQSIIVVEWTHDTVGVYESDAQGDPVVSTRRAFFTQFPKPWGAFFEPETGDYIFLTWGRPGVPDSVFVVQGFEKPPEIK